MKNLVIKPVKTKKQLKEFIKLVWSINKNDPNWVPPLIMDRLKNLDRNKNPFYQHAEAEYFLAYRNGEPVGRIAAIINPRHNKFHEDNAGFFGFLEAANDSEIFRALLETAKNWLKERNKDFMIGPMNPSTNDEAGFLVDGFDTPPYFMMPHNPPYYDSVLAELKYEKVKDLYAYKVDKDTIRINDRLRGIVNATKEKFGVKIRTIDLSKFDSELEIVRGVYNDAWSRNWGFVPMTPAEFDFIANDFKKIIDQNLVLIAEVDNKPIGFSLALPNYNEIFAKISNGRLLPTGWLKFLLHKNKIESLRVITLGTIQKYQKLGIGGIFYLETFERGVKQGYNCAEMSWILEDNNLMNKAAKLLGATLYKTYRIYGTPL